MFFRIKNKFINSILIIVSMTMFSCVGTIEDTETQAAAAGSLTIGKLNFPGITSAVAISHNKVEITFPPAGNSKGDVTYLIKYDGLAEPITAIEKSLFKSYTGEYRYTVKNLTPFTTYSFNVTALDDLNGAEGNNTNTSKATTFLQPTSHFGGVGLVSNVQGLPGLNSLKVEWVKAPLYVDFGTPDARDVSNYQITVLDAEFTPGSINDTTVSSSKRRVLLVDNSQREVIVGGLSSGKSYHIQVRAINHGYLDNFTTDPNFRHEENTKYITKSTLSPGIGDIKFDEDTFSVQTIHSEGGLSSLSSTWTAASGAFDHYRLIYTKSTSNADTAEAYDINGQLYAIEGTPGNCVDKDTHNNDAGSGGVDGINDLFCSKLDFDKESNLIANLDSYSQYNLILLVCADTNCTTYTRSRVVTDVKTHPKIANHEFEGVMRGPSDYNRLDEVYIDLKALADFSTGAIDGFQVTVKDTDGNEVVIGNPDVAIDETNGSLPPLRMKPFDPKADQSIVLTGYQINTKPIYTFSIIPYQNDGTNIVLYENLEKEYADVSFAPLPPGLYDNVEIFEGAATCGDIGTNTGNFNVSWNHPIANSGVFSHYQVFIENKLAVTTDLTITGAAITFPTIQLVDKSINNFTIEGLGIVDNYVVTVRTYYNDAGSAVLSPAGDAEIALCQ